MQTKLKLSEIIKTDCYIDCGSNEKLREVYPLIGLKELAMQETIFKDEFCVFITKFFKDFCKGSTNEIMPNTKYPIHHISEIDLNN